jgi:serine/threonine protein kinase
MKMENIMMDRHGYIKLVDFGLAKCMNQDIIPLPIDNRKILCGTCEYLAPEVLTKYDYGPHTDIWALGVLMFEMLTGIVSTIPS